MILVHSNEFDLCTINSTEIVGYYYDEEKKRFFPTRGPIPGSSRKRKSESSSSADKSQKPALESDQVNFFPGLCEEAVFLVYRFKGLLIFC